MKKLLLFLIVLLSIISVSACGDNDDQTNGTDEPTVEGEIVLKFWHGFTGADGDSMKKMVDKFNEENTYQITIEMEVYNWDTLFT